MAVLRSLQLLPILLVGVYSACDQKTLDQIKNFWNGSPPTNLAEKIVGTTTYVYLSESVAESDYQNISCFTTNVDKDQTSAKDVVNFYDNSPPDVVVYNFEQNEPGVLAAIVNGTVFGNIYVLFFDDDVIAYYQCSPTDESFLPGGAVGVKNYNPDDATQADGIQKAKKAILDLQIDSELVAIDTSGCN